MSSNYFNYNFYIQDENQRTNLKKLIDGKSSESIEESLQKIGFLDCLDKSEGAESLEVTDKGLSLYQYGHTVNAKLLVASKKIGSDFVHVNIDYDEFDEDQYYHRGQLVKKEHVDILLKIYDPKSLAVNNLFELIETRDITALKQAIKNGLDVNSTIDDEPLLHSVYSNQPVFHFLLNNGANLDIKDEFGYTLLMKILDNNDRDDPSIILDLLEKGADVSQMMPEEGGSTLWHAMRYGGRVVEKIKEQGGIYSRPANIYEDSSYRISIAIEYHDHDNVTKFYSENNHEEEISELVETCVTANNVVALELLIDNGYDLLSKKNESNIIELLGKSLSYGSLEMARYLIEKIKDSKYKLSKLDGEYIPEIAGNPEATDILKILIPHFDSLLKEGPNSNGIVEAIQSNALENAKVLIEAGCALDDTSDEDFIIPVLAQEIQEITGPMAQLLIDAGADPYLKIHKSEDNFEEEEDEINNNKSAIQFVIKDKTNRDPELVAVFNQLQNNLPADERIWEVVEQGDLQSFKTLFQQCPDKNITNKSGNTLLQQAVKSKDLEMVKWLSQQGINQDNQDEKGNTALASAMILRDLPIIKQLLGAGANANDKITFIDNSEKDKESEEEIDGLMDVMGLGAENAIDKERERLEAPVKMSGNDAACLMDAANSGDLPLMKLLLENGAEIDAEDDSGRTAIYFSAENGHLDCVKYLHEKGAKVEIHIEQKSLVHELSGSSELELKDRHILEVSAYRGHIDICEYLVNSCGIDINLKSKSAKNNAIVSASVTGTFLDKDIVSALLELGADANSSVKQFLTGHISVLHICVLALNSAGAKLLIDHGADRDKLTIDGESAYDLIIDAVGESGAQALGFDLEELKPVKSSTVYRKMIKRSISYTIVLIIPAAILLGIVYYFSETWAKYLAIAMGVYLVWDIASDFFSKDKKEEDDDIEEEKPNMFAAGAELIGKAIEANEKKAKEDKAVLDKWEEA